MIVTAGKINVSVYFYIVQDASATSPGEPVIGLLFSNLTSASYMRQGAARVAVTPITLASASAAHADGGFILVDDTNMPGFYRFDLPDAAFLTGVDQVISQLVVAGAQNSVVAPLLIDITDVDLRDSVRGGMTAMPNAAADAAGGLPVSDAGALDLDARLDAAITSRLAPTVAGRTLDVTTTGAGGIDFGNVEGQGTAVNLSATTVNLVNTTTANSDMRGTDGVDTAPMRGTDNAALAVVLGALADVASAGDPTTVETLMQYIKQLINTLEGTAGIPVYPTAADPANNVSLAEAIRAIRDDVTGLAGATMRGTDGASTHGDPDPSGFLDVAVSSRVTPAQVNTEVSDVVKTDTIAERAQGQPTATPTLEEAIMYLYHALAFKLDVTSGFKEIHNSAGTVIAKKALTDDATTYSEARSVTGP